MKTKPHKPLSDVQLGAIAKLFATLSEASRLRILQVLQARSMFVGEIVEATGFKQANVSKQLGVLLAGGIISRRQDGNRAHYSIALPIIDELCNLVCSGVAQQAIERAQTLGGT